MQPPKVSIIIVNYNNVSDSIACLKSLSTLDESGYILETIFVDNGSRNEVVNKIQETFPKLNILRSSKNLGFAGGNNLGIKQALKNKADYLFLINNDTLIKDSQLISELIDQSVDITSPVVKYKQDEKTYYDYGGKVDWLFARNTHIKSTQLKTPDKKPDYLSGVSLFVKSEVFEKTGLLDDNYFLYYEDADFCLRAKDKGFRLKSCHSTTIYHQLSSSANKLGSKKLKILAQSQWRFARKHLPKTSLPFAYLYHLYLRLKAVLDFSF